MIHDGKLEKPNESKVNLMEYFIFSAVKSVLVSLS